MYVTKDFRGFRPRKGEMVADTKGRAGRVILQLFGWTICR